MRRPADGHRGHGSDLDRRAEPILGWRAWRVAETREGLRLRSGVFDDEWKPRRGFAAACTRHSHAAPAAGCVCGIYAARDPREAARYLVGRDDADVVHRVVGLVALTGRVVEHERGWRAARGVPVRLWVPAADTNGEPAPVARVVTGLESYGVRVDVVPAFEPAAVARGVDQAARSRRIRAHTRHVSGVTLARERGEGRDPNTRARASM